MQLHNTATRKKHFNDMNALALEITQSMFLSRTSLEQLQLQRLRVLP